VAEAGGDYTRIQSISFDVEDRAPYYEEARSKAVEDAENKAKQLADLAGVGLGKASFLGEGGVYSPSRSTDLFAEGAASTPISPGELEIEVYVQVIYEIV
jgi:uncharacterized protein YggE